MRNGRYPRSKHLRWLVKQRSSHLRRRGGVVAPGLLALVTEVSHSPFPPPKLFLLTRRPLVFLGGIVPLEGR